MGGWVLWLLVVLVPDELSELADRKAWDELASAASERLSAEPGDVEARYWLGRAQLERSLELLAGDSFSRDLARALLERSAESLAAIDPVAGGLTEDARDWLILARFERVLLEEDADTSALSLQLEQEWERHGRAMAASLLGSLAQDRLVAATWFGRAVEADPERPGLLLDWADALSAAGRQQEARAAWVRAKDAGAGLDALLAVLVAILPGRAEAGPRLAQLDDLATRSDAAGHVRLSWHRAYALAQLERLDEAAAAFAAAPRGTDPDYDRAHADVLRRSGRHAEAAELLAPWIERRNWAAYDDLVGLADELGLARRWDESLDLYGRALAHEDRDERARRNQALTLSRAGRPSARQAWQGLVELFPGRADILNDAALDAWGAGDPQRARSLLEQAAELPGAEDARENLAAWLLRADEPRPAEANALLELVLDAEPDRDRALYLRLLAREAP